MPPQSIDLVGCSASNFADSAQTAQAVPTNRHGFRYRPGNAASIGRNPIEGGRGASPVPTARFATRLALRDVAPVGYSGSVRACTSCGHTGAGSALGDGSWPKLRHGQSTANRDSCGFPRSPSRSFGSLSTLRSTSTRLRGTSTCCV